ncbi:MAG: tetratricopeptide repeat protein [bacterium]
MSISRDNKKQYPKGGKRLSGKEIPKKNNLSDTELKKNNPLEKKTPKWFYAVLVLTPIVVFILLEIFLRIIDYGYNLEQWVDAGQGKYIINPNIGRRYFPSGDFIPNTIEDVFDQQKSENSFRVFVLGESSAQGYPFNPLGSFSRYIRKRLELVYPNTTIEVVNLGMTAINSYTVLDILPGVLDQKPDLILVYTGHNEYYGAMGVGSVESYGSSRSLIKLMLYLNNFKLTQSVRNTVQWLSSLFVSENSDASGTLMSRMAKDKYILLNSEKYNAGLDQFKENLEDILLLTKDKGVPIILGRLASNLKDQRPFISVNTPGYKTANQVYEEAAIQLGNNNFKKADSLFTLAKDLDALRFRAPQKMNKIIDELGKEFHVATVPIDSLFNNASEEGIVGDNLMVDHLHPNVRGYQLIGKAFYDCMQLKDYLPKAEVSKIPFDKQDSLACADFVFTKLDSVMGNDYIKLLKIDWPYTKERAAISNFQPHDFYNVFQPEDFIDSLAMLRVQNKISWIEAHLIGATYNLRRDDIEEYLKYMNAIICQYPGLHDLDGVIKYFFEQKKINLADYTPKRNGLMALYIKNYRNAIRHLTEAYKSNPDDPIVLFNLSSAYMNNGELKSALSFIEKCLKIKSNYPEAGNLKREIINRLKSIEYSEKN